MLRLAYNPNTGALLGLASVTERNVPSVAITDEQFGQYAADPAAFRVDLLTKEIYLDVDVAQTRVSLIDSAKLERALFDVATTFEVPSLGISFTLDGPFGEVLQSALLALSLSSDDEASVIIVGLKEGIPATVTLDKASASVVSDAILKHINSSLGILSDD